MLEKANPKSDRWTIDWADLKAIAIRLIGKDGSDFKRSANSREALSNVIGDSWRGFSTGQLERWLKDGFQTEAIRGLEDFIPPIREKRKFVFSEEGDEFHFDIAAGGGDNYMSHFTKRDEIPGLAIDAEIGMVASNRPEVLNAYYTWLCRVAFSIEAAGIDTEITLRYATQRHLIRGQLQKPYTTVIRVKKENEASDFLTWSAMLSPASFRGLMFVANDLHADARGMDVSPAQGQRSTSKWAVKFNPDKRTLNVDCAWSDYEFPETQMTANLRTALKEAGAKK